MLALSASDLSFQYDEKAAPLLKSVSFQLQTGKIIVITGPSGCGKSTFAACLAGVIPEHVSGIFQGEVSRFGTCGMVFQDPDTQIFMPLVEDELAFAPENLGLPVEEIKARIEEVLQETGLEALRKADPGRLSGGQKQLVALGAVLTLCPEILILDEALAQIDEISRRRMKALLCRLKEQGVAILMIEHETENMDIADEVFFMEEGSLSPLAEKRDAVSQKQREKKNPVPSPKKEILRVEELGFFYESKRLKKGCKQRSSDTSLFNDLSFSLYAGEITALVGGNGAGKTTLGKLLTGILTPQKGRVLLEEADGRSLSLAQKGSRIGYCFQNPANQLFTQSVEEEVSFGFKYGISKGVDGRAQAENMLSLFELDSLRESFPLNLSWGEKRRLVLAAVLALEPAYLILDEPTTGLDAVRMEVLSSTLESLRERGIGILVISHNKGFVQGIADRVLSLQEGGILDEISCFS